MSLITLSHTTNISQDDIKKFLVTVNSYERKIYEFGDLVKEYPSTLDEPFALTGTYEIPTNWPVFWNALDEVSSAKTDISTHYNLDSSCHTVAEFISDAIRKYKKSVYYQKAKEAKEAEAKAVKDEAERVRQDVPAITARYETLEKEYKKLQEILLSYKQHLRSIKSTVYYLDREVGEKNLPKWLKKDVGHLRYEALKSFNYNPNSRNPCSWEASPNPLRLSDFSEAQIADGTADREMLAQKEELVNMGFG
jgi:hypothetical protein